MAIKIPRLPSGFQEVEYIQSTAISQTSGQYIDLGITPVLNQTIDAKFSINSSQSMSGFVWCSGSGDSGYAYGNSLYWGGTGNLGVYYNNTGTTICNLAKDTLATVSCKITSTGYTTTVNGTTYTTSVSISAPSASYTLKLFKISATENYYLGAKVYYLKVYNGTTLVHYFVPCLNTSTNKYGLYDTIGNQFYGGSGTGDLTGGSITAPSISSIKWGASLPSEYQQVEYLQSSGSQYIDTTVSGNMNYSVEAKGSVNNADERLFGVQLSSLNYRVSSESGTIRFYYGTTQYTSSIAITSPHIIKLNGNKAYIDGTLVNTFTTSSTSWGYNLYLCAVNTGSASAGQMNGKMYYAKVWNDSGTLIRWFIPCYRKSDNKPCMYDVVNGVPYFNAGSGTDFTVGSNVYGYPLNISKVIKGTADETGNIILCPTRNTLMCSTNSTAFLSVSWTYGTRTFIKTTTTPSLCSSGVFGTYTGAFLVSRNIDGVSYTSSDGGSFTSQGTITFMGQLWYYSGGDYSLQPPATASGAYSFDIASYTGKTYSNDTAGKEERALDLIKYYYYFI